MAGLWIPLEAKKADVHFPRFNSQISNGARNFWLVDVGAVNLLKRVVVTSLRRISSRLGISEDLHRKVFYSGLFKAVSQGVLREAFFSRQRHSPNVCNSIDPNSFERFNEPLNVCSLIANGKYRLHRKPFIIRTG